MSPILLTSIFDDPGKQWLAIGGALFLVIYFVIRPMARRRTKDPLSKFEPGGGGMAKQRGVEREMSNLLVELSEMARQVTAQLDTRSTKLELLMREADEKIETLRQLNGSAPQGQQAHSSPMTYATSTSPPVQLARQSSAERDALMQPLEGAPPAPVTEAQIDARHAEIYALADQGSSPRDIASRLGRPSGEIELILALRQ
jgi:hypothetical protein